MDITEIFPSEEEVQEIQEKTGYDKEFITKGTPIIHKTHVEIRFWGFSVSLYNDGHYHINDTSG